MTSFWQRSFISLLPRRTAYSLLLHGKQHEVVPIMKAQGGGHIVNISSVAGRQVKAGYSGYNASKWALGAFSESLRQEVTRQHIRVTVIEPGMVATELR